MTFQDYLDLLSSYLPEAVQFMADLAAPILIVVAIVLVFIWLRRFIAGAFGF